ncbi:alpha-glucosidase [Galbitalea soli]|nr:alpha-glucosidase [Galbitalea soli]
MLPDSTASGPVATTAEWWRTAVIYQIYPRSFADGDGDGIGDLGGIAARLPAVAELGVDAIWLSPFYVSPQTDGGYDVTDYCDVDPLFGTLADFDRVLAVAHGLGLRVIIDLVPNHSSAQHPWFQEALASPPGSAARARYLFRDGTGPGGDLPPNNWRSGFGGPAWTRVIEADGNPGQWYLHIFDSTQPDFDWRNPEVRAFFEGVLRFWLDRGVDGFRVDVAHGLIKAEGLPDAPPKPADAQGDVGPFWGQPEVHDIYREWHALLAEYDGDRALCAEAWILPAAKLALWVRPDEMQQAFNFQYLSAPWSAPELREVIDESLAGFDSVGAPSTWVLSNHDVVRHATRFGLGREHPEGQSVGPLTPSQPDAALGLRRARAATALMLALPGSSYLFQGEELGLPEVIHLPDEARQDPVFLTTGGERYGRDGCRVPIPWEADAPAYGFNETGASWLPQPEEWARFARSAQRGVAGSTLELYRSALALRREYGLGSGDLLWFAQYVDDALEFTNGPVAVMANLGRSPLPLPRGTVILSTAELTGRTLPPDATAWVLLGDH